VLTPSWTSAARRHADVKSEQAAAGPRRPNRQGLSGPAGTPGRPPAGRVPHGEAEAIRSLTARCSKAGAVLLEPTKFWCSFGPSPCRVEQLLGIAAHANSASPEPQHPDDLLTTQRKDARPLPLAAQPVPGCPWR
jgi:hypothetical protein